MTDMPKLNPYKTMLLTFNPRRVYGWEREIMNILQVVTAAEPASYTIYGIRAIGKTTLLKYLKHPSGAVARYSKFIDVRFRHGESILIWVYINFHQLESDMHIFFVIYEALYDELDAEGYISLLHIEEPDRSLDMTRTARRLRNVLRQINRECDGRVIFLMDDFDIPLLAGQITLDDDRLLRGISEWASLVIATDEPISKLIPEIDKDSPLLGIISPQRIGLISEEAARRLIQEPAQEVDITYHEREIDMLLEVGGRQPYLLTVACEIYLDMRPTILDMNETMANPALRGQVREQLMNRLIVLPHVRNTLNLMWSKNTEYHDTLVKMARLEMEGVPNSLNAAYLETRSLAYTDSLTGNYRLFSALLADYIRRQANIKRASNNTEEAMLMQVAGNLTPIDRGVFEYLIGHIGEVCTFDALLEAVWDQGGGTKRALEAAVHRLRRDVPPGHRIENVRSRGYKYVIPEKETV